MNKIFIIIIRYVLSVFLIIIGKLFDKEVVWGYFLVFGEIGVKINYYIS